MLRLWGTTLFPGVNFECNKNKCYDCHYDGPNGEEVELGEYCGSSAEDLENSGYTDSITGVNYTVHCGEH